MLTNTIYTVISIYSVIIVLTYKYIHVCILLRFFSQQVSTIVDSSNTVLADAISIHSQECALVLVHWGCSLRVPKAQPSYFQLAAEAGLDKLLRLLMYIKPSYANEWRRMNQQSGPLALYSKVNLFLCRQLCVLIHIYRLLFRHNVQIIC